MTSTMGWTFFGVLVVFLLAIDLFAFNRKAHEIRFKEAVLLACFWIAIALLFGVGVYFFMGQRKALEYLTGFILEKSLSVDNLFVFIMIFSYFKVEKKFEHTILFWGILGAILMRAVFIFAGVALIRKFEWVIYVFGAFLVYTGVKMAMPQEDIHPDKNPVIRLARRFLPIATGPTDGHFFVKQAGKWMATPMFIVLLVIESTDVVFAIDSIPAVLAISTDPFIVYTSNIFAILGLRALYFAVAGAMTEFHYLKHGLSVILCFVGVKMLIHHFYAVPIGAALGVVAGVLAISVIASVARNRRAAAIDGPPSGRV